MKELKLFKSPVFGKVRTVITSGQVMFVASDVAKALGYAVPQKAVLDHCKHCSKMEHPSYKGTYINIIPESDMYRLTMKSKLPNAEQFQDWVCEEVIPSIRKTGGYIATKTDDTPEEIMARALTIAQATLEKREERLKQLEADNQQKDAKIAKLQPKADFADAALKKIRFSFGDIKSLRSFAVLQIIIYYAQGIFYALKAYILKIYREVVSVYHSLWRMIVCSKIGYDFSFFINNK